MSRRTVTCVEWVCDDCGEPDEYDNSTIHYRPDESMPDAWETIDGKDVCDGCLEVRHCAEFGHAWSAWYQGTKSERRWCETCGTTERRDA